MFTRILLSIVLLAGLGGSAVAQAASVYQSCPPQGACSYYTPLVAAALGAFTPFNSGGNIVTPVTGPTAPAPIVAPSQLPSVTPVSGVYQHCDPGSVNCTYYVPVNPPVPPVTGPITLPPNPEGYCPIGTNCIPHSTCPPGAYCIPQPTCPPGVFCVPNPPTDIGTTTIVVVPPPSVGTTTCPMGAYCIPHQPCQVGMYCPPPQTCPPGADCVHWPPATSTPIIIPPPGIGTSTCPMGALCIPHPPCQVGVYCPPKPCPLGALCVNPPPPPTPPPTCPPGAFCIPPPPCQPGMLCPPTCPPGADCIHWPPATSTPIVIPPIIISTSTCPMDAPLCVPNPTCPPGAYCIPQPTCPPGVYCVPQPPVCQTDCVNNPGASQPVPGPSVGGTVLLNGNAGTCSLSQRLTPGMSGASVTCLQKLLAQYPSIYPEGLITGYFGPLTVSAVQRFQTQQGIATSGTPTSNGFGMVGPRTLKLLVGQ